MFNLFIHKSLIWFICHILTPIYYVLELLFQTLNFTYHLIGIFIVLNNLNKRSRQTGCPIKNSRITLTFCIIIKK